MNHKSLILITIGFIAALHISCKKDDTKSGETFKDIDGNSYNTIAIGTQVWMKENLKTTKFRDGSAIPNIPNNSEWTIQSAGAYCFYNNDISNLGTYGALYNYFTVVDSRNLCPTGWHVPTNDDWNILVNYLGGIDVAGGKLKSNKFWVNPAVGTSNSSGFSALPGGYRDSYDGVFYNNGSGGYWWKSDEYAETVGMCVQLSYGSLAIDAHGNYKVCGLSVRCIKD